MNIWWVNHKNSYISAIKNKQLWSPKTKKDGKSHETYKNMGEVKEGDIIISYIGDYKINAIGIAQSSPITSKKPEVFEFESDNIEDGWLLNVTFEELLDHIDIYPFKEDLKKFKRKHFPFDKNGNSQQGGYLHKVDGDFLEFVEDKIFNKKLDNTFIENIQEWSKERLLNNLESLDKELNLLNEKVDEIYEKSVTVLQRLKQEKFKKNIKQVENKCRVTGLENIEFLIASHIKPWSKCIKEEKIDKYNGLLLSPHIDYLFDRGYISFSDCGDILISRKNLDVVKSTLKSWNVNLDFVKKNKKEFTPEQKSYLKYHRDNVFLK